MSAVTKLGWWVGNTKIQKSYNHMCSHYDTRQADKQICVSKHAAAVVQLFYI